MANDRMELRCNVCQERITIAKHSGAEWYWAEPSGTVMDHFLEKHMHWEVDDGQQWRRISLTFENDEAKSAL
jgi:hypothetical protein